MGYIAEPAYTKQLQGCVPQCVFLWWVWPWPVQLRKISDSLAQASALVAYCSLVSWVVFSLDLFSLDLLIKDLVSSNQFNSTRLVNPVKNSAETNSDSMFALRHYSRSLLDNLKLGAHSLDLENKLYDILYTYQN